MNKQKLDKDYTRNAESIEEGLLLLKIDIKNFPAYNGPESYSAKFKKCSVLHNDHVISSYDANQKILAN